MVKFPFIIALLLPSILFSQNLLSAWGIVNETSDTVYNKIEAYSHHKAMVVGNKGVVKTTSDGGETWNDFSDPTLGNLIYLEIHNDTFVIAGDSNTLYVTKDFGKSWKQLFHDSLGRIMGVLTERDRSQRFWISVYGRNHLRSVSLTHGEEWFTPDQTKAQLPDSNLIIYHCTDDLNWDTLQVTYDKHGWLNSFGKRLDIKRNIFKIKGEIISLKYSHFSRLNGMGAEMITFTNLGEYRLIRNETLDEYESDSMVDASHIRYKGQKDMDSSMAILVGKRGKTIERHAYDQSHDRFEVKELNRGTTQDLKWIDVAPDRSSFSGGLPTAFTFFSISDNQILRMRYNWKPKDIHIERKLVKNLSLYPNPSQHEATLEFELLESAKTHLEIYSRAGALLQTVFEGELSPGLHQHQLPSGLPKGVYFVRLRTGVTQTTRKWLVE